MQLEEQSIIDNLQLKPHPEGGFYRENYRSDIVAAGRNLPESFGGKRALATSILFFLPAGEYSAFHKLKQDEVWYFHNGQQPELHFIYPDHRYEKKIMGPGLHSEEHPQVVIPAGSYFAASCPHSYALFGCLATPGFDFADLDMPPAVQLTRNFPEHESIIRKLTRS